VTKKKREINSPPPLNEVLHLLVIALLGVPEVLVFDLPGDFHGVVAAAL
jgi:hypothetical protein